MLYELKTAYAVDQAIMREKDRLVVVLFGQSCKVTAQIRDLLQNNQILLVKMAIFYFVNTEIVQEFSQMYQIENHDVMFFYNNRHMVTQYGHKLDKMISQEDFVDLIQKLYIKAKKGQFTQ